MPESDGFTARSSCSSLMPHGCGYVIRGGIWDGRRPLCVRGHRVPGSERSTHRRRPAHGRPRTSPRTGAERPRTGPAGAVMQTALTRIPALTCHFRMPRRGGRPRWRAPRSSATATPPRAAGHTDAGRAMTCTGRGVSASLRAARCFRPRSLRAVPSSVQARPARDAEAARTLSSVSDGGGHGSRRTWPPRRDPRPGWPRWPPAGRRAARRGRPARRRSSAAAASWA
jgi:hypothetical protein